MKQAQEAVILCDPGSGEILEANPCFTRQFGYDLHQDGPLFIFELTVDTRKNVEALLAQVSINGFIPMQCCVLRHKKGTLIDVERSATLVRYGGRSMLVQTLRDVSDIVRREHDLQRDAEMATRVQNALLPEIKPSDYLKIATVYQPFGYVGGDLYFLDWRYGGSLLRGFLVDATGHGLGTALHTASLHVLLREVNEQDLPLSDAMRWLNRRSGGYFDEGSFACGLGFELDLQTRQLRWVCAGIPKVWMATQTQQGVLEHPGLCLGLLENETFDTHTTPVDVGDNFYFMTDGLAELLQGRTELPLERYPDMVKLLLEISKREERRDDATALCIHVQSLQQSIIRQDGWPKIIHFNGYGDYQRLKGAVGKVLAEVTGKLHSLQEVAVNEALANAMECRDGVTRQHKARLRFNKVGNRLVVRVKTSRLAFAGNAILRRLRSHPEEMFAYGEDASMGRGIPMMLSVSDKMTYNGEGTEVLLAWKLNSTE
ncbi:MAG: SpoIIE family protein phosphatase [Negativicutes bacterium]